ncbi:MAG: hypothetical protein ACKO91_16415, partial [Acidimicrobiales bacterium]
MSGRSAQLLREATKLCGSTRDDGLVELSWSQRKLATGLGISVRTLQYHLRQAADLVVATSPRLVIVAPTGDHTTSRSDTGEPAPLLSAAPSDRVALAVALVSLTERLVGLVERLLDDDPPGGPPAVGDAPRAGDRASNRAGSVVDLARWRPVVSQSDPSSDGLTEDLLREARAVRSRGPRAVRSRGPRAVRVEATPVPLASSEELDTILGPLEELCRRTNLPGVDAAGRHRVARFDPDEVHAAVRHVIGSIRSGATVRRPFGLLISELDAGRHRPDPTRHRPGDGDPEARPESGITEPDVVLPEWADADIDTVFDAEVRPGLPALLGGVPAPMRRA